MRCKAPLADLYCKRRPISFYLYCIVKEGKRYYKNAQKCYISHPCSEGPNDAIFTDVGTVVDLTYVMTYANLGWYQLKGGHSVAVQILPLSHDFNDLQ